MKRQMGIRDHITPARIANAIMQDKTYKGCYLIVEGNNDYLCYKKFINTGQCIIKIAYGNPNVIEVVSVLESRNYLHMSGIIDADLRRLTNNLPVSNNILLTDSHDLETMLIQSPAFEHVIESYCSKGKYEAFLENKGDKLRNLFLQIAKPIAYFRWVVEIHNYQLRFKPHNPNGKQLQYVKFIEKNDITFLGYDKLITVVKNYSGNLTIQNEDILLEIKQKENEDTHDLWQLCNGHDFTNIIAVALLKALASSNAKAVDYRDIERNLVLAYDSSYFKKTLLYSSIRVWEKDHKPHRILSKIFD
ncbi:MAG: DUF4435 domain-containing protein [Desulfobacteraceae bacterium]|nr:DUF4435 domain-containing protein [Desulfobacteraceae bacterium]